MMRSPFRVVIAARALAIVLLAAVAAASCGRSAPPSTDSAGSGAESSAPAPRARVVALGDSLTAGYGLAADQSYPSLLQGRLRTAGLDVEVINAGVSGDTSAGGLRRVDWALDGDVKVLLVALGANDALRGLAVDELERNLAAIIERAQGRGIAVILAGMEAPPNLGSMYTVAFRRVYRSLSDRYDVPLLPFLLDGVAGNGGLNQSDGIHPNAEGTVKVADNLWPLVERAVRAAITP
jgi:acyl-CoA thioesterase-1